MPEEIISDQEIDQVIQEFGDSSDTEDPTVYSPFEVDFERLNNEERAWNGFVASLNSLPEKIQTIIMSADTRVFLQYEIGEVYQLSSAQSAELSRIVRNILMGVMFSGDMVRELVARLRIDPTQAQEIKDLIVKSVFTPALEDIKKVQAQKFPDKVTGGEEVKPSTQRSTPLSTPVTPNSDQDTGNTLNLRK